VTKFLVLLLSSTLAATIPRAAACQQTVTAAQLNGDWSGTLFLDNSHPVIRLSFAISDTAFAGEVYLDGQSMGKMTDGSIDGSRVHFRLDTYDLTGTVSGTAMRISLIMYNGSTRTFVATKNP